MPLRFERDRVSGRRGIHGRRAVPDHGEYNIRFKISPRAGAGYDRDRPVHTSCADALRGLPERERGADAQAAGRAEADVPGGAPPRDDRAGDAAPERQRAGDKSGRERSHAESLADGRARAVRAVRQQNLHGRRSGAVPRMSGGAGRVGRMPRGDG